MLLLWLEELELPDLEDPEADGWPGMELELELLDGIEGICGPELELELLLDGIEGICGPELELELLLDGIEGICEPELELELLDGIEGIEGICGPELFWVDSQVISSRLIPPSTMILNSCITVLSLWRI